jgi:predicted RNA-binding protein with PIN domain
VVFDSYPPVPGLKQNYVNVDIIFSRDETADEKIKKMVEKSSRPRNIVVVSDDKEIKLFVKSVGARVLGAEEFINRQEKQRNLKDEETAMSALKPELNYSEILKINRELKKIWLK